MSRILIYKYKFVNITYVFKWINLGLQINKFTNLIMSEYLFIGIFSV